MASITHHIQSPIAVRIERLPLGKFHRRFITLVSLGNFFDFYDIFVVASIGAALQQSGFLSLKQFSFFVASGFLGMFFGTIFFGMGSDRIGRRVSFIPLLLLYSIFTLAPAFSPSPAWLISLRFFAGVGIGAEIVVIDTYVTEIVPSYARGRYVAITQVAGFMAVPVAAILSRLLVPTHFLMAGWRWVMVIGASGALLAWWFRRRLPESPRWAGESGTKCRSERGVGIARGGFTIASGHSADYGHTRIPAVEFLTRAGAGDVWRTVAANVSAKDSDADYFPDSANDRFLWV